MAWRDEDEDGEEEEQNSEERAAELVRREDLDRRLREMIERYRVHNAEKRPAAEGS